MTHHPDIDDLKRHLLGKTSGQVEEDLDLAILRNDGSLDPHLSAAIGEIYDDIASGALSKKDQESFLERFPQTPDRITQLRVARSLRDYVKKRAVEATGVRQTEQTEPQSVVGRMVEFLGLAPAPAWRYALAAVLVASVSLNLFLATEWSGKGVLVAESLTLKPVSDARPVAAQLTVDEPQSLVELNLDIGSREHDFYEVTVVRDGERSIWTHRQLQAEETARTTIVKVLIPADMLGSGHYTVVLNGISQDGRRDVVGKFSFSAN